MSSGSANRLTLHGVVVEISPRRVTPGGVEVVAGAIEHRSQQIEAGVERSVQAHMPFVAVGEASAMLGGMALGTGVIADGFVASRSLKSRQLVMHITGIRFVEGMNDGFQTEAS